MGSQLAFLMTRVGKNHMYSEISCIYVLCHTLVNSYNVVQKFGITNCTLQQILYF